MKTRFIGLSCYIFCIFVVLVLGCARPPIAEMENAREVVFRAENDNNASQYAAGTLARARDALQRMQTEADNKRYDAAKTNAAEAISLAERAINEGRLGAERARENSDNLVTELRSDIEETERNVNGARYSLMDLDYDTLDREIVNAHDQADRAEVSQTNGRYQEAADIARDVRSNLVNINNRVANAAVIRKK